MNGRTFAQLFGTILLYVENMAYRVKCIRSGTELPCGRQGVVLVFLQPKAPCFSNYFVTPGSDRNGVSPVIQKYQIPFREELSQRSALSCAEV